MFVEIFVAAARQDFSNFIINFHNFLEYYLDLKKFLNITKKMK